MARFSTHPRNAVLLGELFSEDAAEWRYWRPIVDRLIETRGRAPKRLPSEWRAVLERAKRRRLVEEQKKGDRLMVRLTDRGRYLFKFKNIKKQPDHYPVGEGCIVVFDIPESQRVARDTFRRFLVECGFRQFQQSVWVCRKDVAGLVAEFVRAHKFTPWIHVIEGRLLT